MTPKTTYTKYEEAAIAAAREAYTNDELEIDDSPAVSYGGDSNGMWIAAWVWVSEQDVLDYVQRQDKEKGDGNN